MNTQNGHPKREGGIALLIVLLVVFVFTILAGGFAYNVKIETTLARNAQDDYEFEWLGRSGMEFSKWVLGQQMTIREEPYDSLNQFWAGRKFDTNDVFEGLSLQNIPIGRGNVTLQFTDVQSKFNINIANEEVLTRATELIGIDVADAPIIVDSILDWIDRDNTPRDQGVEEDHYLDAESPHRCKNGPLDSLTELLLVNGVEPEMFWGTDPVDIQSMTRMEQFRHRQADLPEYTNSFVKLFTTLGTKLNPNTCSSDALQLFGLDPEYAETVISERAGFDGVEGTEDDQPFRSPQDFAGRVGAGSGQLANLVSVRSAVFRVDITTSIGERSRQKVAYLFRRNDKDVRILFSYWE
ncbi:MAG: general secretion pathway protein GspK [Limisphaerales bacterium]